MGHYSSAYKLKGSVNEIQPASLYDMTILTAQTIKVFEKFYTFCKIVFKNRKKYKPSKTEDLNKTNKYFYIFPICNK